MNHRRRAFVVLMLTAALVSTARAGVHVALLPSVTHVNLGADFQVVLQITEAGSLFNAYAAAIAYDPSAITFVQEPLSSQEGAYMHDACGNTFQTFHATSAQLTIEHVIICTGMALSGPGNLYVLHFRAGSRARLANIAFASVQFLNGGGPVPLSSSTGASVMIGSPTDSAEPFGAGLGMTLVASPNPFVSQTILAVRGADAAAAAIDIHDSRGRLVRVLEVVSSNTGAHSLSWDGCDSGGARLAAGVYWATLHGRTSAITRRLVLLR